MGLIGRLMTSPCPAELLADSPGPAQTPDVCPSGGNPVYSPARAYPPGMMGLVTPPATMPSGKATERASPMRRPMAAPGRRFRVRAGSQADPVPTALHPWGSTSVPSWGGGWASSHGPDPITLSLSDPQHPRLTKDKYGHEVPSGHGDCGGQNYHPELWVVGTEGAEVRGSWTKVGKGGTRQGTGGFPREKEDAQAHSHCQYLV